MNNRVINRKMKGSPLIIQSACSAILLLSQVSDGFAPSPQIHVGTPTSSTALRVSGSGLSPLPKGISPFEKSMSKSIDIQGQFRKTAKRAIDAALADGLTKVEIEFPPVSPLQQMSIKNGTHAQNWHYLGYYVKIFNNSMWHIRGCATHA